MKTIFSQQTINYGVEESFLVVLRCWEMMTLVIDSFIFIPIDLLPFGCKRIKYGKEKHKGTLP